MRIENWSITICDDPYKAPELLGICLMGQVYGQEGKPEGRSVETSRIIKSKDGFVETQSGSVYELGQVDPDYEKLYPDAYNTLMGI